MYQEVRSQFLTCEQPVQQNWSLRRDYIPFHSFCTWMNCNILKNSIAFSHCGLHMIRLTSWQSRRWILILELAFWFLDVGVMFQCRFHSGQHLLRGSIFCFVAGIPHRWATHKQRSKRLTFFSRATFLWET